MTKERVTVGSAQLTTGSGGSWVRGSSEGDEKVLGSAITIYETVALSFVIQAKPRDLQFSGPFLETHHLAP
jgi:hypothetical protein